MHCPLTLATVHTTDMLTAMIHCRWRISCVAHTDKLSLALHNHLRTAKLTTSVVRQNSSAVAEMGDRGHNRHGPKKGGAVPLPRGVGGDGSPSNTMWPGLRSTSVPSGIFIYPAV